MELEEARKAGLAPAALDEDGKEINPHIPQYMTTAPWYMKSDGPTLKHQRNWNQKVKEAEEAKVKGTKATWYERGKKTFQATKYRKGACQNCGAMTHKTKDCLERPRARGARWSNKNIAADEQVTEVDLDYDGKRDRWNGYDARDYSKVQQRYEKIESLKQEEARKKELEEKFSKKSDPEAKDAEGAEGGDFLLKDEEEAGFAKVEKRVRTTAGGATGSVRNLRIREDTAKYLLNLDVNSAHYDPKSRSMRADPNPDQDDADKRFRGDAHLLKEGEVQAWNRLILHSTSSDAHMQALPSQAELLYKEFKAKKEKIVDKSKTNIEALYGNAASKNVPDQRLLLGQTERYVEYNRRGQVVKGEEAKVTSRYEEDVLANNHKAVWGSWWRDGVWGYACCRQTMKNSYCTGGVAGGAADGGEPLESDRAAETFEVRRKMLKPRGEGAAGGEGAAMALASGDGKPWEVAGASDRAVALDKAKLKAALEREDGRDRREGGGGGGGGGSGSPGEERKRGYNSLAANDANTTAEELEAYKIKRVRADDPMLNFKSLQEDGEGV